MNRHVHIQLIISILLLTMCCKTLTAQSLQGTLTDENGKPIEYASIYIKETRQGTTSNQSGRFNVNLPKGTYNLTFRCLGFETVEKKTVVKDGVNKLDITMIVRPFQIAPVVIGHSKEDIAYNTMRHAISMAPYYQNQVKEFKAEVYMKGTIKVKKITRVLKRMLKDEMEVPKAGDVLMQESVNNIHFTAPDKYEQKVKMIRSNMPFIEGSDVMGFVNANFYAPMIENIILPLSPQAFNHYEFKNVGYSIQGSRVIDKIKVTPKRKSKQLVEGYIYIADEYWNLHEVDLLVNTIAGTIRVKQTFGEIENNVWIPVSHYFEVKGKFMGNEGDGWYVSSVKYHDVKINTDIKTPSNLAAVAKRRSQEQQQSVVEPKTPATPAKAKTSKQKKEEKEAAKLEELIQKENPTTREMYQMVELMEKQALRTDTIHSSNALEDKPGYYRATVDSMARQIDPVEWNNLRPVVLSDDEIKVDKLINSQVDTTGGKNNLAFKRGVLNVALTGIRWRNQQNNLRVTYSGLLSIDQIDFNTVDGLALNAMVRVRKDFSKNSMTFYTSAGYAFSAKSPRVNTQLQYTYAPKYRGNVIFRASYNHLDFNNTSGINRQVNSLTSLFMGDNYLKVYKECNALLSNQISPSIGFDIYTAISAHNRQSLENNTDFIFIPKFRDDYTPNIPINANTDSTNFGNQKLLQGNVRLIYTPFQRYKRDGNRIAYTQSAYPTFDAQVRFAIPSGLNNDVKFVNWEFSIKQRIKIGALSELNYCATYGDFANTKNLHFSNFKHFNTQLAYLSLSDFSSSFQTLNYYQYSTQSAYIQLVANYKSPFLLIKLLPVISERLWNENLHFAALYTQQLKPYYEFGYSVTRIAAIFGVGVFAGFNEDKFESVMLKVSIDL